MTIFNKPSLSISEHIDQWLSRGLFIPDPARARRYLSVISYYRLSAYTLPFQVGDPEHHFRTGTTFDAVLDLYIFVIYQPRATPWEQVAELMLLILTQGVALG